ncbi:MAG: PQQ-binding-like beta-propeller repeat protein [Pseudomonadota bacterium]
MLIKKTQIKKTLAKICCLTAVIVMVQGCGITEKVFDDPPEEKLAGERLTVLELQAQLEPDPVLQTSQITLPQPRRNQFWPQYAGYPHHAMGHVGLNAGLERAWRSDIGKGGGERNPVFMPPIVADGMVFTIDANMQISAFDADDGKQIWDMDLPVEKQARDGALGGGLAYAAGRLYVTAGLNKAFVLQVTDGKVMETIDLPAPARAAPSVLDGQLYIQTLDNRLAVYDTKDFSSLWSYEGLSETTSLLGSASPAVDKDIVAAAFSTGEVVALRNSNGQTLWIDNLSSLSAARGLSTISDIRGAVVLDKGIAYVISYSGRMAAIDVLTGDRVWQKQIGGTQTPWAAGNVVYVVTSDQQMVALSRLDGRIYWVEPLPKAEKKDRTLLWQGPVLAGGRLITVNNHGHVLELDPATGKVQDEWETGGKPATAPVVADNTLYVLTTGGDLMAYR